MRSTTDLLRRPSRMIERASEALHLREAPRRPLGVGGLIALLLLALGLYWLFPEIRRYARIERM